MRTKHWLAVIAAALILGIAWYRCQAESSCELQAVSDALWDGDKLYFIESSGNEVRLLMTNVEGQIEGRIDVPKLQGDWWNTYGSLTMDLDGQVYVYCYSRELNGQSVFSAVYLCDFEASALAPVYTLPDERFYQIQVTEGWVYFCTAVTKDSWGIYRVNPEGGQELFEEFEGDPFAARNFFYHPDYGVLRTDCNSRFYFGAGDMTPAGIRDYVNIRVDLGGISYMDAQAGTVNRIPFQTLRPEKLFDAEDVKLFNKELDYMDVQPFHYYEDGSWAGSVDITPERRVLGLFREDGAQTVQISRVTLKPGDRFALWLNTLCLCLAAAIVLAGTVKLGLWLTKGTVPIIVQLLLFLTPLIIVTSLVLENRISHYVEERMLRTQYGLLYGCSEWVLNGIDPEDLKRIELQNIPADPYYRKIFEPDDYYEPMNLQGNMQSDLSNVYVWLLLERDGALRYASTDEFNYYGSRISYERTRDEIDKMYLAMNTGQIVQTRYNDLTGDFIALYVPVLDKEGKGAGVWECGLSMRVLAYEQVQQAARIRSMLNSGMTVLFFIMLAALAYFLFPLIRFKYAVERVSEGNLGMEVRVRGRDEVAGIGAAFNHMSRQLKEYVEFIQACLEGYEAFVPERVFELLERKDITQVRLGDQREIEAAVLNIGSMQFQENARNMSGDELYPLINQMLKEMIPAVAGNGGIVERMEEDGLNAYYPQACEPALKSAILISQRFRAMRTEGHKIPIYRASISYGRLFLGMVGGRERMAASAISDLISMTGFLKKMGESYGVKILVLESAAVRIPDFKKRYHVREIGTLYRKRSCEVEYVYDVYDGDEAGDFRAKERTKSWFEKAMAAYRKGKYYDARLIFAKILKENGNDLAAREYVYRCDRYYQLGKDAAVRIHLEEY